VRMYSWPGPATIGRCNSPVPNTTPTTHQKGRAERQEQGKITCLQRMGRVRSAGEEHAKKNLDSLKGVKKKRTFLSNVNLVRTVEKEKVRTIWRGEF